MARRVNTDGPEHGVGGDDAGLAEAAVWTNGWFRFASCWEVWGKAFRSEP
jgi:hypothetical protein